MDERVRFVGRLLDGEKMVALCREFAISRPSASVGCPHNRMRFPRHLRQEASAYLHSPDKLFALEDTFALRVASDRVTRAAQVALLQCSPGLIPSPQLFLSFALLPVLPAAVPVVRSGDRFSDERPNCMRRSFAISSFKCSISASREASCLR